MSLFLLNYTSVKLHLVENIMLADADYSTLQTVVGKSADVGSVYHK